MLSFGPFGAGLLAGLAIALPLGAIGVLIVREGVERGLRAGVTAAVAVACVDFAYATVAVLLGERVSQVLTEYQRVIEVVGAGVLLGVVVRGVVGLGRSLRAPREGGVTDVGEVPLPTSHVFWRFVGLTAVNPMTAVYFVALTAGLSDELSGAGAGVAFAVGVFLGSLTWQLVLAASGSAAGARLSDRFRVVVSLLGYGIVAVYAVRLALGG